MTKIERLKKYLDEAQTLVILTGAGISVNAGIADFRGSNGIKNNIDFEHILTYGYMVNNPNEFYDIFNKYLYNPNKIPTFTHKYLASISNKINCLITQNIDDLHERAGSLVVPLHGSSNEFYCMNCEKKYNLIDVSKPHYCECGGLIRPNVTLYGEPLDEAYYHKALVASQIADTFLVIGTSLNVSPARDLINYYAGNRLIIINKDKTNYDKFASLIFHEDCDSVFKKLVELENE